MSIFDQPKARSGCPLCGKKRTMQVGLVARQLDEHGQTAKGARIVSKTVSLCSEHGELIYLALNENFDARLERASA